MFDTSTLAGGAGVAAGALLLWSGIAYTAAPSIGERLVKNSGQIEVCEGTLRASNERALSEAIASIPKPAETPDVGGQVRDTFGAIFNNYPNGGAFMKHYGGQLKQMGDGFAGPVREKFDAARREYNEKIGKLKQMGELNIKAASSACECRARAAINSPWGRSGLAWHVGTFGLIADAPVNDWQAAFSHPEVSAQCRGMS